MLHEPTPLGMPFRSKRVLKSSVSIDAVYMVNRFT
jgi:hypothetical protein